MSRKLATAVHLTREGVVHSFLPGDTPPEWAVSLIDNPKAWGAQQPTERAAKTSTEIPPKAGKGSGIDKWRAYADANGFDTDEDASRDDIIAALDAGGIPTEK